MQYEAIYENERIIWLTEKPPVKSARIAISILEEIPPGSRQRRQPSPSIAGLGKTLGDLVNPLVNDEDWECRK
jgi:hypothetical protein